MEENQNFKKENLPKLVIATDNFIPRRDGITRFLTTIIPSLKKNFQITIICPDFQENNIDIEGIKFLRIPFNKKYIGDFKPVKFSPKIIKKGIQGADLVFSQTIGPIGGLSLYYAQKQRIKTIAYIHSIDWKLVSNSFNDFFIKKVSEIIAKIIAKKLYRHCTYLITPSDETTEIFNWEKINTPKKVIHLGVDSNIFIPYYQNPNRSEIRKMYGITEEELVIGYHGRLSKEKDLYTLLRAFVHLRKKYKNIKLMIVGSGIPSIVSDFVKQKGVIYVPATPEVADFLSAMDIYCLSSLTETTSLSTLEAMSCCLPVVSTGVGFTQEYIQNGENGYFFTKRDSYDLARKIEKLILSKEKRVLFGEKSREVIIKRFKWENTIKELNSFLIFLSNDINYMDNNLVKRTKLEEKERKK
jgi:glycosyltransferase involved in cell wall biosynthesis